MDFSLNDDQARIKKSTIEFAQKELNEDVQARERNSEFYYKGWDKCAEFGIFGLPMPEEYGGLGLDLLTTVLAMEGLGYGCRDSGLLFSINSHMWTCLGPLLNFGTDEQKQKYLPGLISGTLRGGHAMTEPNSGSDAFDSKAKAVKKGDKYILNGSKIFITNAPIADVLLVFASTDSKKGFAGFTVFLVEKHFPGFSVGNSLDLMGLKTCPIGEVVLQDCEVPEENVLGSEGMGAIIFNSEMEMERGCLFATHLGAMEKDLEDCIDYANLRVQFGSSIGKYQAIANKIANMKVKIELARNMIYKVAWMKSKGKRATIESAIAKLFISESYVENCLEAIQIHGAYGYSKEMQFEKNLRDSIGGKIYSGTSEIQRNIISSFMGL
jgi:alkylation response protein AidB-like acyl-CoA dehydrogenase